MFTPASLGAAIAVESELSFLSPVPTLDRQDVALMGIAPQIVSVMGINAIRFVVPDVDKWAELGLVFEHVKVCIIDVVMQEFYFNVFFAVSVAAVLAILALVNVVWVSYAEFFFILGSVVVLLKTVVTELARVPVGALFFGIRS